MKRHTWTEESRPWTWVHDLSKVLLSCGPLIAVPQALRGYELCRPAAGTPGQSRLAHVLREGWRASCWGAFLGSSSRAAEALRHLCTRPRLVTTTSLRRAFTAIRDCRCPPAAVVTLALIQRMSGRALFTAVLMCRRDQWESSRLLLPGLHIS